MIHWLVDILVGWLLEVFELNIEVTLLDGDFSHLYVMSAVEDISHVTHFFSSVIPHRKLLHGHQGVWPGRCTLRGNVRTRPNSPIPIPPDQGTPWCPFGWTPPPRADGKYEPPQPPPEAASWPNCTAGKLPCMTPPSSGYVAGQTLLFDVVADMAERRDVAAENPKVVADLLARLQRYNDTHCSNHRCLPDDAGGKQGTPSGHSGPKGVPVWLPWRGDSHPSACDTNRTAPADPTATIKSNLDTPAKVHAANVHVLGWCWDSAWSGGGVPPMTVRVSVDGNVVVPFTLATVPRAGLPSKTGAPNTEHGFEVNLPDEAAKTLASAGVHSLDVDVYLDRHPTSVHNATIPVNRSPACFKNGVHVACKREGDEEAVEDDGFASIREYVYFH